MSRNEPYTKSYSIVVTIAIELATCKAQNGTFGMAQNAIQPFAYFIWIHWNNCPKLNGNDGQLQSCVVCSTWNYYLAVNLVAFQNGGSSRFEFNTICCGVIKRHFFPVPSPVLSAYGIASLPRLLFVLIRWHVATEFISRALCISSIDFIYWENKDAQSQVV